MTIFYCACWTDSDCLLSCWHNHNTIEDATHCFNCAGAYVVAVEDGVMRALSPTEEMEEDRAKEILSKRLRATLPNPEPAPQRVASTQVRWRKGEGLFEFVSRLMDSYGYPEVSSVPIRLARGGDVALILMIDFLTLVLNWINSWEIEELERIHAQQVRVWLEALRDRAQRALEV